MGIYHSRLYRKNLIQGNHSGIVRVVQDGVTIAEYEGWIAGGLRLLDRCQVNIISKTWRAEYSGGFQIHSNFSPPKLIRKLLMIIAYLKKISQEINRIFMDASSDNSSKNKHG